MEGLIATILLALVWNMIAWTVCFNISRIPRFLVVAMLSVLAFAGFFVTTVYISHGRIMTMVEGLAVFCGLLMLNALLFWVTSSRRKHGSNS